MKYNYRMASNYCSTCANQLRKNGSCANENCSNYSGEWTEDEQDTPSMKEAESGKIDKLLGVIRAQRKDGRVEERRRRR